MKRNDKPPMHPQKQQFPHPLTAAQHPFQFRERVEHRLFGAIGEGDPAEPRIRLGIEDGAYIHDVVPTGGLHQDDQPGDGRWMLVLTGPIRRGHF